MINYRQGGKELQSAWFEYKEQGPKQFCEPKSLVDFVAGYSAAKNEKSKVYILFRMERSGGYSAEEKIVEGVFSSLESVEKYKEKYPLGGGYLYYSYYEVEEFEVQK